MKIFIKNNKCICSALFLLIVNIYAFSQSSIVRSQLLYNDDYSIYLTKLKHISNASYTIYLFFPNFHGAGYGLENPQEFPSILKLRLMNEEVVLIQVVSDTDNTCAWRTNSYTVEEYRNKLNFEEEYEVDSFMDVDLIAKNMRDSYKSDRICTELYNNNFKILMLNFQKDNHSQVLTTLKNIQILKPQQIEPDLNVLDSIKWDKIEQAYCFLNKIHSDNLGIIKNEDIDYIKIYPINIMKSFFVPQNFWYIKNFSLSHYKQAYINVDTTNKKYFINNNSRPSFFYVEFSDFYNGDLYANVFLKRIQGFMDDSYFSYRFSYNENGLLSTVERIKVFSPEGAWYINFE